LRENKPKSIGIFGTGGGCGQSTSAVFLAKELANTGKTVCLVDLNFNNPNLHTLTSLTRPSVSLNQYWEQEKSLNQIITKTDYRGLYLLAGNLSLGMNLKFSSLFSQFLNDLKKTPFDYIILDISLENQAMNLDTLCWCDKRAFILEANPSRVESFYNFFQKLILRKIRTYSSLDRHFILLKEVLKQDKQLFNEALNEIASQDSAARSDINQLTQELESFILLNKVNEHTEAKLLESIQENVRSFFSINLKLMGHIMWSEEARLAWKSHKDVLDSPLEWKNQNIISLIRDSRLENQL